MVVEAFTAGLVLEVVETQSPQTAELEVVEALTGLVEEVVPSQSPQTAELVVEAFTDLVVEEVGSH